MVCCSGGRREPHKLDSKYSWLVCACGVLCNVLVQGIVDSLGILYPAFVKELQETNQKTAWIGSLCTAVLCFSGVFAGALCDKLGCRLTAYIGIFLCTLGLLTTSYATNVYVMYFTFGGLFGIGGSLEFTAVNVVTFRYFKRHRSLAIGILSAGEALGTLVMAPLMETLIESLHLRTTLRIMAGMVALCVLVIWTFNTNVDSSSTGLDNERKEIEMKKEPDNDEHIRRSESNDSEKDTALDLVQPTLRRSKCSRWFDWSVWKIPQFTVFAIAQCIGFTATLISSLYMAAYCEELGISSDKAAWMYVFLGVASFAGRIGAGRLIDNPSVNSRYVYQISVTIAGVAALVCPLYPSFAYLSVCFVFIGLMSGSSYTCVDVLVLSVASEERRGRAMGMFLLVHTLPVGAAPPLAGFVADLTQSYAVTFYVSGALYLCAASIPFILMCACVRNKDCYQSTKTKGLELARTKEDEELETLNC